MAGLLFIYLPMIIMVIYPSTPPLPTVWGGLVASGGTGLLDNKQLIGSVFRPEIASTPPSRRWR